jgi:hypothetical protein
VKKINPYFHKPSKLCQNARSWIDGLRVVQGIPWILRSGERWLEMPKKFLHLSTRLREMRVGEGWSDWSKIWGPFLSELNEQWQVKWSASFLDGSFTRVNKVATEPEKPSGAMGRCG